MKNLYFNYVAIGESVVEWIVNNYVNAIRIIYQREKEDEIVEEALSTVSVIEKWIDEEKIYNYLPHIAFDKSIFLYELRAFAQKYKKELNPVPSVERINRTSWSKLELTNDRKDEMDNESSLESRQFVQGMCDDKLLMMCENSSYVIAEYMNERLSELSEDERRILTLRYGLNGEPCMSYKEICMEFDRYELFEIMKLERDSLINLF